MYAIFETGGKQYKVQEGDVIRVEKLGVAVDTVQDFNTVLFAADGDDVKIGAPYVSGATVTAQVMGDGRAKKVIIYKYKPKKGFHKKKGHRQPYTELKIEKISL